MGKAQAERYPGHRQNADTLFENFCVRAPKKMYVRGTRLTAFASCNIDVLFWFVAPDSGSSSILNADFCYTGCTFNF